MNHPRDPLVVGVLLAAGAGHRLGHGPKALLSVDGRPEGEAQVTRMVTALLRGGCDEVVVVAGAAAESVRSVLDGALEGTPERPRCRIVVNPDWASGMGSSFRAGVDAAGLVAGQSGQAGTSGQGGCVVVVALVDQPDIGASVVAHLLAGAAGESTGHRVTAAGFADGRGGLVRGHPLAFPLPLAREAAALAEGDAAGRLWLRGHPELVDVLDVGHLATGRDVDTPSDLQWWARRQAHREASERSRIG